jgi:hypothetical protein
LVCTAGGKRRSEVRKHEHTHREALAAAADLPERLRGVPVGGAVAAHVGARRQLVDEALVDLRQRLFKRHCETRRAGEDATTISC